MIYIDTSLVISFIDERDSNHSRALDIIERMGSEERAVSSLVLLELSSVYSRADLDRPLELALYSIESVRARIFDLRFDHVMRIAFRTAPELKLRTLDLLHVSACRSIGADKFVTLDGDIINKRDLIRDRLGITVISP
ncbi:MAG: PIN domain-containing protein [Methanothrix sp.]|nr:PIN domain-containing protein [Methanothrix sp.]MCX8207440.1 PIN domain-containing protein [Methanothrix sp.]